MIRFSDWNWWAILAIFCILVSLVFAVLAVVFANALLLGPVVVAGSAGIVCAIFAGD